ncbi:NrsF family protein [Mesorhizobium sp. Mes31]|uniref:NrsF family protein n=1 Tax=Mesorhizobium sp. Mes31 TaxID=2926017 RepID=UPI002117E1A7|nr:NrsF family protein [Mesorhizobium sp. Mes31]
MKTDDLIKTLTMDARRPALLFPFIWWGAVGLAILVAASVFFATLGLRPDFAAAAQTPRFLFKFVVTISLAASAFVPARALSTPGNAWRKTIPYLAVAPMLIAVAVIVELFLLPPDIWSARMIGRNSMVCLTYIPLIGIGPLCIFLAVLRHGASTRPTLAGAVCGIFAGAIAATLYAAQCTDDSPLFVATWYTIAIAGLAVIGAVGANRVARW